MDLRHLWEASTHALCVMSPAPQVLAGLFMRGHGGLAMADSVGRLPMENQWPTPACFQQTGRSREKLLSGLLGRTASTAQGASWETRLLALKFVLDAAVGDTVTRIRL